MPSMPLSAAPASDAETVIARARALGAKRMEDTSSYIREVYRLAPQVGLSPDIVVAQSAHETATWTSPIYVSRLNVAGIGVTDSTDHGYSFESGQDAARAQVVHLWGYVYGTKLPTLLAPYKALDPRWDALMQSGKAGTVKVIGDLTGKWATDPNYEAGITKHYRELIPETPTKEQPPMATLKQIPGFTLYDKVPGYRPFYLPSDIKVIVDIVPDKLIGWVRSGRKCPPKTMTTWHDTGNSGSTALAERNYLHGGPRDDRTGERRLAGYNGAYDDKVLYILTPGDEDTWAQGVARGNTVSFAWEQCFGPKINWERSLYIGSWVHASMAIAYGMEIPKSLVLHQFWTRKWCAGQILNKGIWASVVNMVATNAAKLRSLIAGAAVVPVPAPVADAWPYPDPVKPAFWGALMAEGAKPYVDNQGTRWYRGGGLYKVVAKTPRQQYAINDNRVVGPPLESGILIREQCHGQSDVNRKSYIVTAAATRVDMDALTFVEEEELETIVA